MAELADAQDLGSCTERCAGSTPVTGTMEETEENIKSLEKDYPKLIRGYREGYLSWHQVVMKAVHGIIVMELDNKVVNYKVVKCDS